MFLQGDMTLLHSHDCNRTAALEISFSFFFFFLIYTLRLFFFWLFVLLVSHSAICTSLLGKKKKLYTSLILYAKWIRNDMNTLFSILPFFHEFAVVLVMEVLRL